MAKVSANSFKSKFPKKPQQNCCMQYKKKLDDDDTKIKQNLRVDGS